MFPFGNDIAGEQLAQVKDDGSTEVALSEPFNIFGELETTLHV